MQRYLRTHLFHYAFSNASERSKEGACNSCATGLEGQLTISSCVGPSCCIVEIVDCDLYFAAMNKCEEFFDIFFFFFFFVQKCDMPTTNELLIVQHNGVVLELIPSQ